MELVLNEPPGGASAFASTSSGDRYDPDQEALITKFEAFLHRASSCQNILSVFTYNSGFKPKCLPSQSQPQPLSQSATRAPPPQPGRHIIVLEDLPNILHPGTQSQFHAALQALVDAPPSSPPVPVVIIVSDAGARGEAGDERTSNFGSGEGGWGRKRDEVVDIRTVLSKGLLGGPYVTQIGYASLLIIL